MLYAKITGGPQEAILSPDHPPAKVHDSSTVRCVHYGEDSKYRILVGKHLQLNIRKTMKPGGEFPVGWKPVEPVAMKGGECRDAVDLQVHGGST